MIIIMMLIIIIIIIIINLYRANTIKINMQKRFTIKWKKLKLNFIIYKLKAEMFPVLV